MDRLIEYLTFQHVWVTHIIIAMCILTLLLTLLYFSLYKGYKSIRRESGETPGKWLSPILFSLILLVIEYIMAVVNNITDGSFLFALPYADYGFLRLVSLAALLIIPITSALILKHQYKRCVYGILDEAAIKGFISPLIFGALALFFEAVLYYVILCIGALASV